MAGPTQAEINATYNKLVALSAPVADAFRSGAPDGISTKDLQAIVAAIVDGTSAKGGDISPEEAEALTVIIDSGALDPDAARLLSFSINDEQGLVKLFNGAGTFLDKTDKQLSGVYAAIAVTNTGNIKFKSPRSGFTYNPTQYQAIAEFVKKGEIQIFLLDERGLLERTQGPNGVYSPEANQLMLMKDSKGDYFEPSLIVHELTHAIQDYYDVDSLVKYVEADAYIAQTVAFRPNVQNSFTRAADIIVAGGAMKDDQAWVDAYDKVVAKVEADKTYSTRKDNPTKSYLEKKGGEAAKIKKVVASLTKAAQKSSKKKKP